MPRRCAGVALLDRVEAVVRNPALYSLAEAVPDQKAGGGRPRDYPPVLLLIFEALISVYGSARQVEAELSHPVVWDQVRRAVAQESGCDLPVRPMRRHHYLYGRNRYLADPAVLAELQEVHRRTAGAQALRLGLLDPTGPGSWTHPHESRVVYGDGKVVTPLYKARPGEIRLDRSTGEIHPLRHEPDADLHFEGTGETAWGTKFVLFAARGPEERARVILDWAFVEDKGGEAQVAMAAIERLSPHVSGAQALVYDTALRGTHHQRLLRDLGIVPVNRVTAAKAGARKPRRAEGRRVEKSVYVENKTVTLADRTERSVQLFARGGAIGLGEIDDTGEVQFVELPRTRTHRIRDKSGLYRWYNNYALPAAYGHATVTVRLHGNDDDAKRRFNRTENVRAIAPPDPDFKRLFRIRNDAESINRGLDDSMYLRRAHSLGHRRQLVNFLGYALMVNGLALQEHRRRAALASAA
ncbi:MAG TPA: hypothetical protein VK988_20900 [Acidimicrobiales bacterium]|nr:hypothetical protein [Acidimicrobiales bacterium]